MNAFVRFKLTFTNFDAANALIIKLGWSCDALFGHFDVHHGCNVLEQIDQYNSLSAMFMNCQINLVPRAYQWSISKGYNTIVGTKIGIGRGNIAASGGTISTFYTTMLLSGVVGSLS